MACMSRCPDTTRSPWFSYWPTPAYGASTDWSASLACSSSGSSSSLPSMSSTQQRVPTLPTPTTLRAMSTIRNCWSRCRRSDARLVPYRSMSRRSSCSSTWRSTSGSRSCSGTINGGSAVMRRLPSTTVVSLLNACTVSRVRAVVSAWNILSRALLPSDSGMSPRSCSVSAWVYQTSRLPVPAKPRIASRYARTVPRTTLRRCLAEKSLARPHDHETGREPFDVPLPGAGQRLVEVVDVEDQMPFGEASSRKFSRCASPQSCA